MSPAKQKKAQALTTNPANPGRTDINGYFPGIQTHSSQMSKANPRDGEMETLLAAEMMGSMGLSDSPELCSRSSVLSEIHKPELDTQPGRPVPNRENTEIMRLGSCCGFYLPGRT